MGQRKIFSKVLGIALVSLMIGSMLSGLLGIDNVEASSSYNRQAAANYAITYAYRACDCGKYYGSWPPPQGSGIQLTTSGGDCAHFVSHCLAAGGLSNKGTEYASGWCEGGAKDYIITVHEMRDWFNETGVATEVSSVNQLEPGDVIVTNNYGHVVLYIGTYGGKAHQVASHSAWGIFSYTYWGTPNEYWHITVPEPSAIYVPDDYSTIQAAVNAASPGDTIIVRDGTYTENIDVNKDHLTIKSENGAEVTIVQAANPDDHVFEVTADYVEIRGFTVKGPAKTGIYLEGSDSDNIEHCGISNNIVSRSYDGIHLSYSSDNTLMNNIVSSNSDFGIELEDSPNNRSTDNTISDSGYGIRVGSSPHNTLINNTISSCSFGISIFGSPLTVIQENVFENCGIAVNDSSTYTIEGNTINGKPIYYYKDETGIKVPEDAGQVILANCSNMIVEDIDASNGTVGIQMLFTNDSLIENNTVNSNTQQGIALFCSNNNKVIGNNASSNHIGIDLYKSPKHDLTNNTILWNHAYGIFLDESPDNVMIDNTFENNGIYLWDGRGLPEVSSFNTHTIQGNTINGKAIYYYKDETGIKVPEDAGQVILANCSNMIVEDIDASNGTVGIQITFTSHSVVRNNVVSSNFFGISLLYCSNNAVENNDILDNHLRGIELWESANNKVRNNKIWNTRYSALHLWSSSENVIEHNNISNSQRGIALLDSSDNNIYLNGFIGNAYNATLVSSTNLWHSPEEITYTYKGSTYTNYLGNYWSDYGGSDADADGIGDNPYSIDGDNDSYPLVEPWENYFPGAVLPGDANQDGVVNNLDITKVERIIVGLDAKTPGADANQDGVVNTLDITKVKRIIVGLD